MKNDFSYKDVLRQELLRKAKIANKRFRRIRESGLFSYAYNNAQVYLNANNRINFRERLKTATTKEMEQELDEVNKFLSSKTSTVRGIRQVQKNQTQGLKKTLNRYNKNISNTKFNNIIELLRNSMFYKYINRYISSDDILEVYSNLAQNNQDEVLEIIEEINSQLKKNKNGFYRPSVKTSNQADLINQLFGRELIGFETLSPILDEEEDDSDKVDLIINRWD